MKGWFDSTPVLMDEPETCRCDWLTSRFYERLVGKVITVEYGIANLEGSDAIVVGLVVENDTDFLILQDTTLGDEDLRYAVDKMCIRLIMYREE